MSGENVMDHRGAEDERGEMRTDDTTVLLGHCKKCVFPNMLHSEDI